jgi:hypothetical protein
MPRASRPASGTACEVTRWPAASRCRPSAGPPELPVLAEVEIKKLRHVLRDTRLVKSRLFHGESGRYAWAPPTKEA